jgi:hypothetical protein
MSFTGIFLDLCTFFAFGHNSNQKDSHSSVGLLALHESLNIQLQGTDWVLQLVLLQHSRVQDTEGTNDLVLATNTEVDGSSMAGEVGGIYTVSKSFNRVRGGTYRLVP